MRVETTSVVPANRKSVRITTQSQFNGALFIMDSVHMPTGCGIWPSVFFLVLLASLKPFIFVIRAFWTNGKLPLWNGVIYLTICLRSELASQRGNWYYWRCSWLYQQPSDYPHRRWMYLGKFKRKYSSHFRKCHRRYQLRSSDHWQSRLWHPRGHEQLVWCWFQCK